MRTLIAAVLLSLLSLPAGAAEYFGICEASAGVALDATHFVVASDETNLLRLYELGNTQPVGPGFDFTSLIDDKSDLEGATMSGGLVYWISSHSLNSSGGDKTKRKVLLAAKIEVANGVPKLVPSGLVYRGLRDPLVKLLGVANVDLNIEGLAPGPNGSLLIGLRSPMQGSDALVVPLENAAALVTAGGKPVFGTPKPLPLDGRAIRGIELLADGTYLIVAGPKDDSSDFFLYVWDGKDSVVPWRVDTQILSNLRPESIVAFPAPGPVLIVSDDGDKVNCNDEETVVEKRKFRAVELHD